MTKQQLKDECVRLSARMRGKRGKAWDYLNRRCGALLAELDPMMSDREAMAFYTYCETLSLWPSTRAARRSSLKDSP